MFNKIASLLASTNSSAIGMQAHALRSLAPVLHQMAEVRTFFARVPFHIYHMCLDACPYERTAPSVG